MWPHRLAKMPLRLPLLFALLTLVPAAALGWLTFELVRTDRELERNRLRERADTAVQQAADRIVAASHQRLTDLEKLLNPSNPAKAGLHAQEAGLHNGVIRVEVDQDGITVKPPGALAYYPDGAGVSDRPEGRPLHSEVFAEGERIEHGERNPAKAAEWFSRLAADSKDPALRAGALLRMARNQSKAGDVAAALATYDRMSAINTEIDNTPAELLALVGRGLVLEAANRQSEAKATGERLLKGLAEGRWQISRTTYETFVDNARRWTGDTAVETTARQRAAAAFADIYDRWRADGRAPPRGWTIVDDGLVLTAGTSDARRLTTLIAGDAFLREAWSGIQGIDVHITSPEGTRILGTVAKDGVAAKDGAAAKDRPVAVRTTDTSGLPWTIRVSGSGVISEPTDGVARRQLRLWGVVMVLLLLAGSAYVTWRGVSRELAVARLQADFVAAVSHEFRTPLTSFRHLSEMLAQRRITSDEQREECYEHLVRESGRLERLVEELLDFGRLEEGKYEFRFQPVDLSTLVTETVAAFRRHSGARGHQIEFSTSGHVKVMADRVAFNRALWNLLDNAAKYSPDADMIWVQLSVDDGEAVIRVRDQGFGIEAGEQRQIFGKFYRGSSESVRNVSGTGLGLAMVHHIVKAHGGHVSVESEPNKGSTFALTLPLGAVDPAPYAGHPTSDPSRGAAA